MKTRLFAFCAAKLFAAVFYAVPFVEAVNASCRINKFLLSSIERMACRTNFNVNIFHS